MTNGAEKDSCIVAVVLLMIQTKRREDGWRYVGSFQRDNADASPSGHAVSFPADHKWKRTHLRPAVDVNATRSLVEPIHKTLSSELKCGVNEFDPQMHWIGRNM